MDRSRDEPEVSEVSEKLEKCLSMDADSKMEKYNRLISDGKSVAKQGDIQRALELFKLAYSIHQTPKLKSRIQKIEELLAQNDEEEDEDDEFVNVNNSGLMLYRELHDKLYDYQREGVSFLYGLHRDGHKGGILADDMGLGKTIQIISFLSGMYDNELIKHTLLIMPTSLITNWIKEFAKWTPGMRVKEFHGISKAERSRSLEKVQRRGGVIITTYTMLMNNWQQLSSYHGQEFSWDYVILDEAHKIKNTSTKTAKSAYAIPSRNRILLTGTPVQNNLREMWTLFDFACQGALLGTAKTFKTEYENPITRAREKDATPGEKALGSRMSENLMALIKPYFLRRTKSEVQKKKTMVKEEPSDKKDKTDSGAVMPKLTRKNDLIVWTYLSAVQEDIYRQFIDLDHIKELLMTSRSPLAELNILKKLCDHPRLLSAGAIAKLGLEEDSSQGDGSEANANGIANIPDDTLISESGKLVFLLALLEKLREEGHRTLVFAHYRKVLDIIERILGNRGFKVLRLDGTITQLAERERLISRFQEDRCYSVFLLTTQVGGVGITLTAADRVVIYDPSWNPATDAQAVDRAYRIGQTQNVVIYRLITCGTVEEKIYRRQVFKDSLIRQNTGDKKNPFRYFSRQELKELFTLEEPRSSSTQLQLQALHSRHRRTDPALEEHIAQLHAMHMFGISDHDLLFSLDVHHDEAPENPEEHNYIEGRVQKAQELVRAECQLQMQLTESMAASTEPAWLRQPPDSSSRETAPEKRPRNPRPSPSLPQPHDANRSPVVLDLDQSGSGEDQQDTGAGVIDLTSDSEDGAAPGASSEELGDKSERSGAELSSGPDGSPLQVSATQQLNGTSHSEVDLDLIPAPQNKGASILQQSDSNARAETSRTSVDLDSFRGNFNLQLEDSGDEVLEDADTEEEEQKLLSQLQTNGSFSIRRSLSESLHRPGGSRDRSLDIDQSVNHSQDQSMDQSLEHSQNQSVDHSQNQSRDQAQDQSMDHSLNQSMDHSQNQSMDHSQNQSRDQAQNQSRDQAQDQSMDHSQNQSMDHSQNQSRDQAQNQSRDQAQDQSMDHSQNQSRDQAQDQSLDHSQNQSRDQSMGHSQNQSRDQSVNQSMNQDQSLDQSVVATKKRKALVIYDSEDEDEEPINGSFQVLGASTPKSGSTPVRSRRSVGGNGSVVSRRSLLRSIIEDVDEQEQDEGRGGDGEDMVFMTCNEPGPEGSRETSEEEGSRSEDHEKEEDEEEEEGGEEEEKGEEEDEEEEAEEVVGLTLDELQLEETMGETLNTEGEGEEEEEEDEASSVEEEEASSVEEEASSSEGKKLSKGSSFSLEESTGDPELASGEKMDQFTAAEPESYDWLVSRGKECFSQSKLDAALDFFLKAIDIKPGDPEIQFMTIQLYRQLSQRR
ncbi:DNA excision repair protein ERCC-6-like [Menidia menidia]